MVLVFRVHTLGFRVQGSGVLGLGFDFQGSGCRVESLCFGFGVCGVGFGVEGLRSMV